MTTPTMTLIEAASRLQILAEAYHAFKPRLKVDFPLSELEMEAVTTAAVILGMFVEALEDTTT